MKYRGYIEQCSGFRGVSKAGKACENPAKGGFRNFVSPEIGGGAFKGREQAYAYIGFTGWGGGAGVTCLHSADIISFFKLLLPVSSGLCTTVLFISCLLSIWLGF